MTEERCAQCEAIIDELDFCGECLQHTKAQENLELMKQRVDTRPPFKGTHCPQGHEYNEANTRIDLRPGTLKSPIRACRLCHNERLKRRRARMKLQRTQPREPGELNRGRAAPTGRMTEQTLPVEEQT